jgi:hypothetical protein
MENKKNKAVSSVITTIVITGILLTILVIASFVATNILSVQMANTEFEQAKTNMGLLNDIIQDVALRKGAGGYVQFNERTGGIGINETNDEITLDINGETVETWTDLLTLNYRAGTQVSGAETIITGAPNLDTTGSESIGYLRVELGSGIWIKLDYNRVKTIPIGTIGANEEAYDFYEITFIQLQKGNIAGASGTINARVQNNNTKTTSYQYDSGATVTANLIDAAGHTLSSSNLLSSSTKTVVMVTLIEMVVSID